MSVATVGFASASVQPFRRASYGVAVTRPSDSPREASTVVDEGYDDGWKINLLREVAERVVANEYFEISTLRSFVEWLSTLPNELPRPFLTVAEDGSLVVEWDVRRIHLHVTFDQEGDEAYFLSPADEWEGTARTDKLGAALTAIQTATHE